MMNIDHFNILNLHARSMIHISQPRFPIRIHLAEIRLGTANELFSVPRLKMATQNSEIPPFLECKDLFNLNQVSKLNSNMLILKLFDNVN